MESTTGVTFRIRENVNFSYSSSFDPTVVTTYEVDSSNEVSYYLLKKSVRVTSEIFPKNFSIWFCSKISKNLIGTDRYIRNNFMYG